MLLLPIAIGLTSFFWQQSNASGVKNLVVFGDSYSDVGNLQRLSNGPFWSENLAVGWDASIYSFAYNGAVCDNDLFASDTSNAMPSIKDQIEMYYNEKLNLEPNETVYAFWVGLNDIDLAFKQENGTSLWGDIVDCISTQMRNVRKVFGSNRYLVINIPPMEKMPYFDGDENRKEATEALNERLSKSVTSLNKHYRALEMDLVDVHSMVNDLVENPSKFGFKDASHAYWDQCQGQCTDGLDEYLWWDKVHLTGGAHRAIANSILLSGSLEPVVSLPPVDEVKKTIEKDKRFQSPTYIAQANTGAIDKAVKEIMDKKAKEAESSKSAVMDDVESDDLKDENTDDSDNGSFSHIYFVVMVTVLLCIGFVWFARRQKRANGLAALSGLLKGNNNSRGRFMPLQNLESTNA